jgi:hypothetical protein
VIDWPEVEGIILVEILISGKISKKPLVTRYDESLLTLLQGRLIARRCTVVSLLVLQIIAEPLKSFGAYVNENRQLLDHNEKA